jgi:uncharacterized membrane protein YccC
MKDWINWKAKTKVAIKYYTRLILGYAVFFIVVLGFGWLLGKLLESVFIILGYAMTRFVVPKIKHFNSTHKCISISTVTFLFAIAILCIPKDVSLIWSAGVGATIPLIMYIESLLFDLKAFKDKTLNKDQLIKLCKQHNYNDLKTQIAVKFFIDKEKPKDVWLWLCDTQDTPIEWDSVRHLKCKMKKELFS